MFAIPTEYCRHIQDTFYPSCNFPYSLYREDIATFAAGGDYKQSDATGFISIYGLPTKVQAIVNNEKEGL